MSKIIKKSQIPELFKKLSEYDIHRPVEEDGVYLYRNLGDEETVLEFTNSRKPPKEIFFPQTEKMLDFVKEGNRFVKAVTPEMPDRQMLLFGVRPCDAKAFTITDKLFSWDYIDLYYVNKRERATIIGFTCTQPHMPKKNCFCTSIGGSPSSTEGLDMLWTDIGDSFFVESLTDKGNKILELGGNLFADGKDNDENSANEAKDTAERAIVRKLELDGIESALECSFDSDYWSQFAERCLGCGICTLMCPVCHCFDINDVSCRGKGWRERTWDTCQSCHYTAHASGHNPRPEKRHRQRNRLYHKFFYLNRNLEALGCVGCGRCISQCPVNIDIIEVAEGVKECVSND